MALLSRGSPLPTPPMPGHLDVVEGLSLPARVRRMLARARGGDQEPGDISILLHIEGRMIMMMKLVMLMMAMTKKMMLTGCR